MTAIRMAEGIPLLQAVVDDLTQVGAKFGVTL
jgi:hypothetical protein